MIVPPEAVVAVRVRLRLPRPWEAKRTKGESGLPGSPTGTTHAYDDGGRVRDKDSFLLPELYNEFYDTGITLNLALDN